MQYRIKEKSEKQQQLIDLWVEANRIDKAIVLEMCDTYETQNAIIEYQKWIETNKDISHQEFNSVMQELKKDLENLQQSLSDLIAFA